MRLTYRGYEALVGVPGRHAAMDRFLLFRYSEPVRSKEFCPSCSGFCGECRRVLGGSDLIYWWAALPFHPWCGPWADRAVLDLGAWKPPDRCGWAWCQRLRSGDVGSEDEDGDE